jgi:CRP-like cAMP-binding protein
MHTATATASSVHSIPFHAKTASIRTAGVQLAAAPLSLLGLKQNSFLAALDTDDLAQLSSQMELVELPVGKRLYDVGNAMEYAYFPTNAIVSLQYTMDDGATIEIGVVGREGVVGVAMYAGEQASCSAVVQAKGHAYRLKASVMSELMMGNFAVASQVMRHTSALFSQLAQAVVGARHGNIEQRLCQWLLNRLDRAASNELKVTQELIGNMLGVRRESITMAAGKLQEEGLIECRRGTVVVVDRNALEQRAGSTYLAGRSAM